MTLLVLAPAVWFRSSRAAMSSSQLAKNKKTPLQSQPGG